MIPAIWRKTVLLWTVLLAACTVQLAPAYDQALVEGLDASHAKALTLFAALETGSSAAEFETYAPRYAELIGGFEGLRERALARQVPPLARRLSKARIVQDFCNSRDDPTACVNASPSSLERVVAVIRMLRNRHRSSGLEEETVRLLRRDYSLAIGQAITVENALKR